MTETTAPRLLVLGANGMLGSTVLRWFASRSGHCVFGSVRRDEAARQLQRVAPQAEILSRVEGSDLNGLRALFDRVQPEYVINCIGVVKQLAGAGDPATAIPINALLPHRLARLSKIHGARLINIGTDCVFSGTRGAYTEDDVPDAQDLYGRSKLMGEVDCMHAVTLRTSIIGHELNTDHGLIDWFLGQQGPVRGFARAIVSALPTVEFARVIEQYVIPHPELHGTYHVAGPAISKYELLRLVGKIYGRDGPAQADDEPVIDRSLSGERFHAATGYEAPQWPELISRMREFG
ncbi:NAD(P)-dependent oxidoreductase [Pelomonas sp. Root1217]|uniref:dTDP-4-dehydrorhamnose reductase family protein n=1 Tax=Pelomonas sp. Root1217 TaxID=1736430 RepID=UPI00070FBFE1|nr:SDR family oxidoreductase [Pelomonas sp. Root1217]KQV47048.1 NAD(P)-dependent oxidoreductase [Pelomonas sp. Root1217]